MEEEHESSSRSATSKTFEQALEQAIKDENYELAAKIRDQINQRNKNQ
jgi:protein-arginine kinase activator protein McsA